MGVLSALSRMYVDPNERLQKDTQYFTQSMSGALDRIAFKKAGKEILDYIKSESDEVNPYKIMAIVQKYNIRDPQEVEHFFNMLKTSGAIEDAARQRKLDRYKMEEIEETREFRKTPVPEEELRRRGDISELTMPGIKAKTGDVGAFGVEPLTFGGIPEKTITQRTYPEGITYEGIKRRKGIFPEEEPIKIGPGERLVTPRGREIAQGLPTTTKREREWYKEGNHLYNTFTGGTIKLNQNKLYKSHVPLGNRVIIHYTDGSTETERVGIKPGEEKTPSLVTWTTATKELKGRFGKQDPIGNIIITAELAGMHRIAQKRLVVLKKQGIEPLDAINQAEDFARNIENRFWQYMDAAKTEEQRNKVKKLFRAKYKYEPRLRPR